MILLQHQSHQVLSKYFVSFCSESLQSTWWDWWCMFHRGTVELSILQSSPVRAWYLVCNIFLTAVSEGIFEYPYIVARKKTWAHLGTHGRAWAFSWNLPCFSVHIAWPITAKCPRTQGAAYYNVLTIIWHYSKMLSDTAVKKILQTPPGACISPGYCIIHP